VVVVVVVTVAAAVAAAVVVPSKLAHFESHLATTTHTDFCVVFLSSSRQLPCYCPKI